ncbi:hypothetical protein N657DRAFT_691382 [Parathielavia appendiculata]|uniref:Uncharacterized protein n=1 Tax=Parathielavia appendiculata TaxID=2587402 RepID=A0AAN6TY71_9PEZI|nr:hypothetical protein N657DRAFT_691382 [Parathielavia appendiculata]
MNIAKKIEPVKGTNHGAKEPAIFRPPPPSPSQRFAWRSSAQDKHARVNGDGNLALCPLPNCVKNAETDGSGGDKKMAITNSMMKTYVAMRAGVNSVVASTIEPLLGKLVRQELAGKLGSPRMIHDIHWELSPYLPDRLNRPEIYYYARNVVDEHLNLPPDYNFKGLRAINHICSDGWKAANAKEE